MERFRENRDVYCSGVYNETQALREFIGPLASNEAPIRREIDATGKRINQLAYKLYGLTEAEIQLVENG